jgi:hypothetical protein
MVWAVAGDCNWPPAVLQASRITRPSGIRRCDKYFYQNFTYAQKINHERILLVDRHHLFVCERTAAEWPMANNPGLTLSLPHTTYGAMFASLSNEIFIYLFSTQTRRIFANRVLRDQLWSWWQINDKRLQKFDGGYCSELWTCDGGQHKALVGWREKRKKEIWQLSKHLLRTFESLYRDISDTNAFVHKCNV